MLINQYLFTFMRVATLLVILSFTSNSSAAGGQDGGGGRGILCRNPDFTETLYLADTMEYIRSGGLSQFHPAEDDSTVIAVAEMTEKLQPQKIYRHPLFHDQKVSLGWLMHYQHDARGSEYNPRLPHIEDDNIDPSRIPANCQKVQLAFSNLHTGNLVRNIWLDHYLPWIQRGFLNVHEILIAIRNQPGADTTPIRQEVDRLARALDANIDQVSPMIRHMLLKGRKPGRTPDEERQLAYYWENNCYEFLMSSPPPSNRKRLCHEASLVNEALRSRTLPKLKRIPRHLQCRTTSVSEGGLNVSNPNLFTLTRQRGTGMLPDVGQPSNDIYSLRYSSMIERQKSQAVHFLSETTDFYQNVLELSRFYFSANFGTSHLWLTRYNPKTELFMGILQFGNTEAYKSFSVICHGGPAEIGF